LRGSVPWAELALPPGNYQVFLDVVREGVNWSRPLSSSPQHGLIVPRNIYEITLEYARFNTSKRLVTFTFDAHSDDIYTHELLDVLSRMGVVATFFVTGKFIRSYPELIERMLRDQHEIGNLTNTYPELTYPGSNLPIITMTHEKLHAELTQTEEIYRAATGHELSKIWRAPYGNRNGPLLQWAADLGYRHIRWSIDSYDNRVNPDAPGGVTMQGVAARVEHHLEQPSARGSIVLFHASSVHTRQPLFDAVQKIIETAWSRGYSFRTVGEMLEETIVAAKKERE
jgi:peptidoglycan/xylan/chitin deacetylase (PgdA/CDA1 family)